MQRVMREDNVRITKNEKAVTAEFWSTRRLLSLLLPPSRLAMGL